MCSTLISVSLWMGFFDPSVFCSSPSHLKRPNKNSIFLGLLEKSIRPIRILKKVKIEPHIYVFGLTSGIYRCLLCIKLSFQGDNESF